MTTDELQVKLQERYPLLTWRVIENAEPPAGVLDGYKPEWWRVEASVFVNEKELVGRVTNVKSFFSETGARVILARNMANSIGYEIVYCGR